MDKPTLEGKEGAWLWAGASQERAWLWAGASQEGAWLWAGASQEGAGLWAVAASLQRVASGQSGGSVCSPQRRNSPNALKEKENNVRGAVSK